MNWPCGGAYPTKAEGIILLEMGYGICKRYSGNMKYWAGYIYGTNCVWIGGGIALAASPVKSYNISAGVASLRNTCSFMVRGTFESNKYNGTYYCSYFSLSIFSRLNRFERIQESQAAAIQSWSLSLSFREEMFGPSLHNVIFQALFEPSCMFLKICHLS